MQYNNSKFGKIKNALVESVFNYTEHTKGLIPPPPSLYFIDDSGAFLMDDSGANLTTD